PDGRVEPEQQQDHRAGPQGQGGLVPHRRRHGVPGAAPLMLVAAPYQLEALARDFLPGALGLAKEKLLINKGADVQVRHFPLACSHPNKKVLELDTTGKVIWKTRA